MSEQPAGVAAPPPARWSPGQVALIAAAVMLAVVVGVTLLAQTGVLSESLAALVTVIFLALGGFVAGLIGAGRRRKERWPEAAMAYRVAMWCFFLAVLHAIKYHDAAEKDLIKAVIQHYQEQQRADKDQQ